MVEKRWLQYYDEGIPHTLQPYPDQTLIDVIAETARQRPNHPALYFKAHAMSYAKLERLSGACAAALGHLGVHKGDRVALLMPNTPQLIFSMLGTWKAGGIAVPLNPLYTENELERALIDCGAETAVVMTLFYNKLKAVQEGTKVRKVIATNVKEYLPTMLRILFTLLKDKKEGHKIRLQSGDYRLADLCGKYTETPVQGDRIEPADPAVMLFSGGTTGVPKAVVCTHHALLITGMQIQSWGKNIWNEWDDKSMLCLPLFHMSGLGVFSAATVGHSPSVLIPNPRDIGDLLVTIEKMKPASLPGVPSLFNAIINHPRVQSGRVNFSSLKLSTSGAAPLSVDIKDRFENLTGVRIVEVYTLTESVLGSVATPVMGKHKRGAVGIPLPDIEIRITDEDTGKGDLPPGEVGEILMRAPQLMKEYWRQPTETADTIRDGWLYTGDLGYLDEDGFLFFVERKKDVIKPGGFQVWPHEVEEVIASHPAVAEAAVAGVPDPDQAEAVKAWIVLHEGQQLSAKELREYCRKSLVAYKVPKYIELRDSLPKSTIGKILRRELATKEKELDSMKST
ncbi:MAG: AMP-binding protein [Syntrophobacteraceae bacterium]